MIKLVSEFKKKNDRFEQDEIICDIVLPVDVGFRRQPSRGLQLRERHDERFSTGERNGQHPRRFCFKTERKTQQN